MIFTGYLNLCIDKYGILNYDLIEKIKLNVFDHLNVPWALRKNMSIK